MFSAILRELIAAGLTGDALIAAFERIESSKSKALTGAERSAMWRERQAQRRNDATSQTSRETASESLPKVPPITPLNTHPGSEPSVRPAEPAIITDFEILDEDPKAKLFRLGKTILVSFGITEKRTGSLIGQWLKARDDPAGLLAAIQFARDHNIAEPVAYISALVSTKGHQNGQRRQSLSELARQMAAEAREHELALGIGRPASNV